jgi:hypothetical protein
MNAEILVIVACHNRKEVTRHCLENLSAVIDHRDHLVLFNDGSTEYDGKWLRCFSELVMNVPEPLGIHNQRIMHFQFAAQMIKRHPRITHVYLTDADVIHDPQWREQALSLQAKYDAPVCLYDTTAHSVIEGNTWGEDEDIIWRKYAPGVSYLLTVEHVDVIVGRCNMLGQAWDWVVGDLLGNRFAISRIGYCDHIGIGGDRHPTDAGADGGDRVKLPTKFLIAKRAEIVSQLTA